MKIQHHQWEQEINLVNENIKNQKRQLRNKYTDIQSTNFDANKIKITKKTLLFGTILTILIALIYFSDFNQFSTRNMTVNDKNGQITKKRPEDSHIQQQEQEQQFSLKSIQTSFQKKQKLQNSVNTATLSKMEQLIFKSQPANDRQSRQDQKEREKILEDIEMLSVMIPDNKKSSYEPNNFYFFSVSIREMILNSQLNKMYRRGQTIFKITLKQHMRAIIRTQLVHNVNFKGQIEVELSPFDKSLEDKKRAIKQIMQDEQVYYQSFYQISKYLKNPIRFCILVPSYNNAKSKLYLRNLDSIFMQDYQNYHVVYIDDASPDKTGQFVQEYIKKKGIPEDKIKVYINPKNKKALQNIYTGIHQYCPDNQVVGLIDGDDSFLGRKVFQVYNAIYQTKGAALVYSNFLKILTNNRTSFGFGSQLSPSQFLSGKMRNDMSLLGTHFMTFYSNVFKRIKKQDLSYENGTFYDYAYDRAILTPMVEMVYPKIHYLPQMTYQYRNDTGINDGTENWQRVSKIILARPAYKTLQNFDFIQKKQQGLS